MPPVVVVLVTRDAGERLEESLESLAQQDYRELVVLVVDVDSDEDPTARVASVLPNAYVLGVDESTGFAEAANAAVASVEGARFVLFCHDDVAFKPDAVRQMVEESFRSDAAVVGPKLVRWDHPRELVSVGLNVDRFGVESPRVEAGEFDQQQHDGVDDVFSLSGAAVLVRSEVFEEVGGFDEAIIARGEVLDLCWRTQVGGYRVIVAPMARVRWSGSAQLRSTSEGDRLLLRRHRLRSILTNYKLSTLLRVLPVILIHDLVEMMASALSGRRVRAREVASSWRWNLAQRKSARERRKELKPVRRLSDFDVRRMQEPGSTRVLRFLRARFGLAGPDEALGNLRVTLSDALMSRAHLDVAVVVAFAAFVFFMGSRHLIWGSIAAFGDFLPIGDSASDLRSFWGSGVRFSGLGSETAAPTLFGLLGLLDRLPFVSAGNVVKVLTLGALPFGWFATWRLARRLETRRARLAAVAVSLAIPLPYNALALGDWSALTAWAVAPLILGRLIDASEIEPLAIPRPPLATVLGLGAIVALAATVSPVVVLMTVAMGVVLILGSLLHGSPAGMARVAGATIAAAGMAIVAHLPWSIDLISSIDGWTSIVGIRPRLADDIGAVEVLRFQTGPHGAGWLLIGLLAASFGAVLIGREWRLAAAVRLGAVAVAFWAIALVAGSGAAPFAFPSASTILAPTAAAVSLLAGLTVTAMGRDLRAYRFGWRQYFSFFAPLALLVALAPTLANSFDGRWKSPQSGFAGTFSFLEDEAAGRTGDTEDPRQAQDFRVLWVGHPDVVGGDAWRLTEDVSYLMTVNGFIGLNERWPGPETSSDEEIQEAVLAGARGDMTRLGAELAPVDIRYVVVLEGNAPAPRTTVERPAPAWLTDSLARQLDLFEVKVNEAARIYRNVAGADSDLAVSTVGAPSGTLERSTNPPAVRRGLQVAQILIWLGALAVALPLMVKSRAARREALAERDTQRIGEAETDVELVAAPRGSTTKTATTAKTRRSGRRRQKQADDTKRSDPEQSDTEDPEGTDTDADEIDLRSPKEIDLRKPVAAEQAAADGSEPSSDKAKPVGQP